MSLTRVKCAALLTAILLLFSGVVSSAGDQLVDGFANPPDAAKPQVWWHWMNGNISKEGIKADLEAMKAVGLGGAIIFNVDCGIPHGPVQFMSPEWRGMVKYAAEQASRLGLKLGMHNCSGWSSSGGPWIQPDQAMQTLVWTTAKVSGPSSVDLVLERPRANNGYYRDIAVYAFKEPAQSPDPERVRAMDGKASFGRADGLEPDLSTTRNDLVIPRDGVLNITDKMSADGRLNWSAPSGEWTILRIGHTLTGAVNQPSPPEGRGLECDKLSKDGIDAHWASAVAPVLKDLGPLVGKSLVGCLIDSYEEGGQNWTSSFREEFINRRGYDPMPFLPAVTGRVIGSMEMTERFLWDWRRTVADLFADNYYGHFAELCHQNGLNAMAEPYGNAGFDNLQSGAKADIPMGEFWVGGAALPTVKLAACIAHTSGRTIAATESFTASEGQGRWLVDPYSIKALGDSVFCDGINRIIFHRYAHQPWIGVAPGMTMGPWGMNFERTITWWNQSKTWLKYMSRCQYLLQSGKFAADVCYCIGENAPADFSSEGALKPAPMPGTGYDVCSADTVIKNMSVKNGRIVLPDGMSYSVLVMPNSRFMTPAMARKIRSLVAAGATVVGPKPQISPSLSGYPECDSELQKIADEVWGNCDGANVKQHTFGQGKVICGKAMPDILNNTPDFECISKLDNSSLRYIHRRVGGTEIYFVSNQEETSRNLKCAFRVTGKAPELWHPDTGVIEPAPVYEQENGRTTVLLNFDPVGSVFVVFRSGHSNNKAMASVVSVPKTNQKPTMTITKAVYGTADVPNGFVDVTDKLLDAVAHGRNIIKVSNDLFGDPAFQHVKSLRIDYIKNGTPGSKSVDEGGMVSLTGLDAVPDYELSVGKNGNVELRAWNEGNYTFKTPSGAIAKVKATNGAVKTRLQGPWGLDFPAGSGASKHVRFDQLASWSVSKDADVRYFSGTATYKKTFNAPSGLTRAGKSVYLDFGVVKNIAEVTLNGKNLGCLWKEPFRVDVTGILKPTGNNLVVRVTNLWVNRLIGDEQLPDDCQWNGNAIASIPGWVTDGGKRPASDRVTFTTWKFYDKNSPLLESGILGPAVLWEVPIYKVGK